MIMRLKRIFDIAGCLCTVAYFVCAYLEYISDLYVALFLGTVVYGVSILYRAVKSTPCDSRSARLLGLLSLLRRHHDDG